MAFNANGVESKSEITRQVRDGAWVDSRLKEKETVTITGDRFQELLFRFRVKAPAYALESFRKPGFQLEIAPDFLTDVKNPKDMKKRVLALAAMYH